MKGIVTVILAVLLLSPSVLAAADRTSGSQTPGVAAKTQPQKLDLNRVTLEELVGVPGIGPRMAQAIVDLRQKHGSFARVEDLLEVTGIKEKKLAAISGYLEVTSLPTPTTAVPSAPAK